jgi:hypothetical protein
MPEISRFFGIVIKIDRYSHSGSVFWTVAASRNRPRYRVATLHQRELLADWDRARAREELQKIAPLE